jgi:hypothetical protein
VIEEAPSEYLGLAQSYALLDAPDRVGAEVFSLLRTSPLEPDDYLDAFFDTGHEHQQHAQADHSPSNTDTDSDTDTNPPPR